MDDHELLREYVAHRSERAFTGLVEKHLPFVYATALRMVRDAAAAEDVAQRVFIALARKAWTVRPGTLPGWLYRATQRAAYMAIRTENRRRQRETDAMNLAEQNRDSTATWENLAPLLDEALRQLNRVEQDALLLRYFDGQSMSETGRLLALSEPAAQKRVSRALEKMRAYFARQGVTASAALLATTLGTHAAAPPPAGLAGKITGPSLAGVAGQAGGTGTFYLLLRILSMSTKTQTTLTVAAVIALIAFTIGGIWWSIQPASAPVKVATVSAPPKPAILPSVQMPSPPLVSSSKPTPPQTAPATPTLAPNSTGIYPGFGPQDVVPTPPDPQDNLNTALADMARLMRAGDLGVLEMTYLPPDQAAKITPKALAMFANMAKHPNAGGQQQNEALAKGLESIKDQTPTYNATGDEATYTYTNTEIALVNPKAQTFAGAMQPTSVTRTLVMVKIDGKWYAKSGL